MDIQLPKDTTEQIDYIANWPMPKVEVGEMVVWMPDYQKPNIKAAGFATRVNFRSIECRAVEGEHDVFRYDVLHKDDPRLATNQNMRRNGCWDYAPIAARLRVIEAEQLVIKELLVEIMGEDDFNELVEEAANLGAEDPVEKAVDAVEEARKRGVQERVRKAAETRRKKKEAKQKQKEAREARRQQKTEPAELQTVE